MKEATVKIRRSSENLLDVLWVIMGMAILVVECLKKEYPQIVLIKGVFLCISFAFPFLFSSLYFSQYHLMNFGSLLSHFFFEMK